MSDNQNNFRDVCSQISPLRPPKDPKEKALRLQELFELLEESKLRGEPDYHIDFYSITQDMINFVEAQGYTFILEINNGRAWYTIREDA